jgi:hypothetical protein
MYRIGGGAEGAKIMSPPNRPHDRGPLPRPRGLEGGPSRAAGRQTPMTSWSPAVAAKPDAAPGSITATCE